MTVYELLDVALTVGNRIDVQWGLFITVHLAVFGGIIYVDRPLRLAEKIGALFVYASFAALNYRVMRVQLRLLESSYNEIADRAADGCCGGNQLIEYVAADVASGRFDLTGQIVGGGNLVMAAVVGIAIIFDRAIGAKLSGKA